MSDAPAPSNRVTATEILRTSSPAPRERWRRALEADPYGMATQSPDWIDAMTTSGGWADASICFETMDGRDLVLPMARRNLGGRYAVNASFGEGWGFGGCLTPGGPTASDAVAVLDYLEGSESIQTAIRPNPMLSDVWLAAAASRQIIALPKLAHVLEFAGDRQAVHDEQLTGTARRAIRRAERFGVEVVTDSSVGAIDVFYDLLLQSFTRWAKQSREPQRMARFRGVRRDPLHKFHAMARYLGDSFRLHIAYVDAKPAAAAIVLMSESNAHYTRGAMDIAVAGRTNASDLVHWHAIQDAIGLGCTTYHMGESGTSASLARFKEKYGARPVAYAQYRVERLPLTATDAKLRSAVKRMIGFRDA